MRLRKELFFYTIAVLMFLITGSKPAFAQSDTGPAIIEPQVSGAYCTDDRRGRIFGRWNFPGQSNCHVFLENGSPPGAPRPTVSNSCTSAHRTFTDIPSLTNYVEIAYLVNCGTYQLCVNRGGTITCSPKFTAPNCAVGANVPNACSPPAPPRVYGTPPVDRNIPQAVSTVFGLIQPPEFIDQIGFGGEGINRILDVFVLLIFSVGTIIFLFMILVSAVQWISSGGDKEAIAGARKRVTNAVIGLILLAVAFMLLRIIGTVLNLKLFF